MKRNEPYIEYNSSPRFDNDSPNEIDNSLSVPQGTQGTQGSQELALPFSASLTALASLFIYRITSFPFRLRHSPFVLQGVLLVFLVISPHRAQIRLTARE